LYGEYFFTEDAIVSNQIKCSLEAFTAMISKNASTPRAKSFLQQGGREQRSLAFSTARQLVNKISATAKGRGDGWLKSS
jgi:hypothetical protein